MARCPGHDDHRPSLSLAESSDGKALLKCHAGCSTEEIVAPLGLRVADLCGPRDGAPPSVTAEYVYRDENGRPLYAVERLAPKAFRQKAASPSAGWLVGPGCMRNVRRVPYRLPELIAGVTEGKPILIVEGEKDVDRLVHEGFVATCNTGGVGKWSQEWTCFFGGADVVIMPDNDLPGRRHAEAVAASLAGVAKRVRIVELPGLPAKGDVSDWFGADGTATGLSALIDGAVEWSRHDDAEDRGSDLVLTRVSDVKPERVRWLWSGWIPFGKVTVLDGDPGVGKSTVTLDLATRITTGACLPDGSLGSEGNVLLVTAEDGIGDTVRPRLDAAGANCARVTVFEGVLDAEGGPPMPISIPSSVGWLDDAVRQTRAVLVIIDPLMAFLDPGLDSYKDHHVRRAMAPLARIADRSGAAVIIVRHLIKARGSKAIHSGGGSIGIIGAARSGLLVAPDPNDPERRVLAPTKSNLGAFPPAFAYRLISDEVSGCARVHWEGPTSYRADELLCTQNDADADGALGEAVTFLEAVLAEGPMPVGQIYSEAKEAGITKATIRRAKQKLGVESNHLGRPGEDQSWAWTLPNGSITQAERAQGAQLEAKALTSAALSMFGDVEHLGAPQAGTETMGPLASSDLHDLPAGVVGACRNCRATTVVADGLGPVCRDHRR